jgi:hypothetical protein
MKYWSADAVWTFFKNYSVYCTSFCIFSSSGALSAAMSDTNCSYGVIGVLESPPSTPPSSLVLIYPTCEQSTNDKEDVKIFHGIQNDFSNENHQRIPFKWQLRIDFRKFDCDLCGRRFAERSKLRRHLNTVHHTTAHRRFMCDLCGEMFTLRYDLHVHLRQHPVDDSSLWSLGSLGNALRTFTSSSHKH